jgi:hypothetical protein
MRILPGATVDARAEFRTLADALYDPDTVRLRLKPPAANASVIVHEYGAYARLYRVSIGVYRAEFEAGASGTWTARWEAVEGTSTSIDESSFEVERTQFSV